MIHGRQTQARPLRNPEMVLNLWAYADQNGYVVRIAGRAYVMDGDDASKLTLLRYLSATDFLSAIWEKVPANFTIIGSDGQRLRGVAHASMVGDPNAQAALFGPLMERLGKEAPEQARCIGEQYQSFQIALPETPLTVSTVVMEHADGSLVPMLSD